MPWKLTVRTGPKVKRSQFDELTAAIDAAEAAARELADGASNRVVDAKIRRFEPSEQVVGRVELAGPERLLPNVTGGFDVHGDASVTAYTGRVRRRTVERKKKETAFKALRRALTKQAGA